MIDINIHVTIGAKSCFGFIDELGAKSSSDVLDAIGATFLRTFFEQRETVAEKVTSNHPYFVTVQNMMNDSMNALINDGDFTQKVLDEFNAMFDMYQNDQSLQNDQYFVVLLAATGAFLERNNSLEKNNLDKSFSTNLVTLADAIWTNEHEVIGIVFLLDSALWHSNYKDYQNLVYNEVLELKR